MAYKIDKIEGIGPAYREKLSSAGITTTDDFLKLCGASAGRKAVAERTGISENLLLNWSNKADLMRVSGVGPQFAELLEAAGVDTVKEMQHRNAQSLAAKMEQVNAVKRLAKSSPGTSTVQRWVDQAKTMTALITH